MLNVSLSFVTKVDKSSQYFKVGIILSRYNNVYEQSYSTYILVTYNINIYLGKTLFHVIRKIIHHPLTVSI